ncbi:1-deoxy-D-xylulose-5-phosphate synthase [Streptomyces sp. NPDC055709]
MSGLEAISAPEVLRTLDSAQLAALAQQVRGFLVEKVTRTGGHLGPNLGVVELTIALHRVFDSPRDALVFDTGHQSYVHKLLTGRANAFDSLRQQGGLCGYPSRAESEHDWVENSHASTALSYADGLAKAFALRGQRERRVVAVVGDGALTGGMAWEALNNIGSARERPVIVVVNDNGRSYAPTTGGLAEHLAGPPGKANLFTAFGLAYLGPVDGHDILGMERALRQARDLGRPVVVHARTVKGKGYSPAETDEADRLHAVGVVDPATGKPSTPGPPSWTTVFGQALRNIAARNNDVVAVTASMLRPTGLHPMACAFPDRVFDVGIAEQHAVTSAAGLALGGLHPVVAVYATFLSRAFDQVLMDVGLHRLPVTFVLDRAGITGPDGPSHHGVWDLAVLSAVPGIRVSAPRDPAGLRQLLAEAVEFGEGPTALRLPKTSAGADVPALAVMDGIDILHRSTGRPLDVLLVPVGPLATVALKAATHLEHQGLGVTVADPRWVLPVNPALPGIAARHSLAVSVEDGIRTGGFGSALALACADAGVATPVLCLGLPRAYLPHGPRDALLAGAGLDAAGVTRAVLARIRATGPFDAAQVSRSTP